MTNKKNAAIIGPGNIGTDLLIKAMRSDSINPLWMVGIEASPGIERAESMGLNVSTTGIEGLLPAIEKDDIRFVFDATSAYVHQAHVDALAEYDVTIVELTPAAIGPFCIPPVNLDALLAQDVSGIVNMVTCGGQATIPLVAAVSRVQSVDYAEIVATVASASVGMGTRDNIDEFTRTTASAIEQIGGAKQGKAIIIINPAEPPLIMRDTVHCLTTESPDQAAIIESFDAMIKDVQQYVPGYKLLNPPVFDENRVTISVQVEGLGDFLPKYSGNLDIMTAAALRTAEMIALNQPGS